MKLILLIAIVFVFIHISNIFQCQVQFTIYSRISFFEVNS